MPMANRVRELRKARGLTQLELATALGVNEITIVRWERGYSDLPRDTLHRIACFFQVAPSDLIPDLVPDLTRVRTEEEMPTHA